MAANFSRSSEKWPQNNSCLSQLKVSKIYCWAKILSHTGQRETHQLTEMNNICLIFFCEETTIYAAGIRK